MGRSLKPHYWPASRQWQRGSKSQVQESGIHFSVQRKRKQITVIHFLFRTGRAVRCVLERGDDMLITGGRHPVVGKYKVLHSCSPWHHKSLNLTSQYGPNLNPSD